MTRNIKYNLQGAKVFGIYLIILIAVLLIANIAMAQPKISINVGNQHDILSARISYYASDSTGRWAIGRYYDDNTIKVEGDTSLLINSLLQYVKDKSTH